MKTFYNSNTVRLVKKARSWKYSMTTGFISMILLWSDNVAAGHTPLLLVPAAPPIPAAPVVVPAAPPLPAAPVLVPAA